MLTVVIAFAAFALLMSVVMLLVEPEPIGGIPGASQRQDAETLLYLAAFFVILPLSVVLGPRLADRLASGPNATGLSALAAVLGAGLAAAVLGARLADELGIASGFRALAPALALWWAVAAAALARASRPRAWTVLLRAAALTGPLWILAAVVLGASLLTVTDFSSVDPLGLAVAALAVGAAVWAAERVRSRPASRRRRLLLLDALVVALVLLAIPDLVVLTPEAPNQSVLDRVMVGVMQLHHNFLLGPANQVGAGDALLVDTASQYGVGSILFLAGWFKVVPIGYGTSALLDGVLTALYFAGGYLLLRVAGVGRLAASGTLVVAIVVLVLNRTYPVGLIPQEGPLRFGLPLAIVFAAVAAARRPTQARIWRGVEIAVLGLSAIWSFEAFALSLATFLALAALRAWLAPAGRRRRRLVRELAVAAAGCVVAHLLFAAFILAVSGELPDWGQYLAFLEEFLVGSVGDLTYDVARWSPGLAIGAAHLASAAALLLVVRRRPELVRERPAVFLALAGLTAYGVALFDYFVNRSGDHVLPYVSLPLLLAGVLWIQLLWTRPAVPRALRLGSLALPLAVSALLLAVAWSSIGPRFERTALVYAIPGVKSARDAVDRLWDFPPLNRAAPEAEALLDRHMRGQRHVPVLVRPGIDTEVLMRSGRANLLPIAEPWEDGFIYRERLPGIRDAVRRLRPGQRLLLDTGMLATLAQVRRSPELDPFEPSGLVAFSTGGTPPPGNVTPNAPSAPVQIYALREIDRRFAIRIVARGPTVFVVAELAPRR